MRKFWNGLICRDNGEGGGGGLGEDQLGFLEDMFDESTKPVDSESGEQSADEATPGTESTQVAEPAGDALEPLGAEGQELERAPQEDESAQVITSLRDQIIALTEQLGRDPLQQTVQATVETPSATAGELQQSIPAAQDFLTAEELDRIIDEPALINVAFQRQNQAVMRNVASLVAQEVNKQVLINKAVSDFYTANQDLLPYAKFVQFTMADIERQNPNKTFGDIFTETANECRKRLGLSATTTQSRSSVATSQTQRPAFAGTKRANARPSADTKTVFDNQVDDLFGVKD